MFPKRQKLKFTVLFYRGVFALGVPGFMALGALALSLTVLKYRTPLLKSPSSSVRPSAVGGVTAENDKSLPVIEVTQPPHIAGALVMEIPAMQSPEEQKPAALPKKGKVTEAKKSAKSRTAKVGNFISSPQPLPFDLDKELENSGDEQVALDVESPVNELARLAFAEESLIEESAGEGTAPVSSDARIWLLAELGDLPQGTSVAMELKPQDFSSIRSRLSLLSQQLAQIVPEHSTGRTVEASGEGHALEVAASKPEREVEEVSGTGPEENNEIEESEDEENAITSEQLAQRVESLRQEQAPESENQETVADGATLNPGTVNASATRIASLAVSTVTGAKDKLSDAQSRPEAQPVSHKARSVVDSQKVEPQGTSDGQGEDLPDSDGEKQDDSERGQRGKPEETGDDEQDEELADLLSERLSGKIFLDPKVAQWLQQEEGHIQLYLQPAKSRDPQDTIFLDYEYPNEEFELDMSEYSGVYKLMAVFYAKKSRTAAAQIPYRKTISNKTIRERVKFHITYSAFEKAIRKGTTKQGTQTLSATLFEGASGDYRRPKSINKGEVKVVGFPEWGVLVPDSTGDIRLPEVPSHSELLLEVSAPGYYPTQRVVPTFDRNAYTPLYLISREKVDTITRYFTQNIQKENYGLILGRVFDPHTRKPKEGEELSLLPKVSGEKPLYFGALPDRSLKETTPTGLFGFFNLTPSFRAVMRGLGKRAFLTAVLPGTAQYVELGRGGSRRLLGQVLSPVEFSFGEAKVRLIGDPESETVTDTFGNFEISEVDLAPGILTLEIEAPGYPKTWQSVAWHPRETERRYLFHILPEDVIAESAATHAKLKQKTRSGTVLGGAEPGFFDFGNECVFVTLLDGDGRKVPDNHGPFPFSTKLEQADKKSSEPLCLSRRSPGFAFYNLRDGQYVLKWTRPDQKVFRAHVLHIGLGRVTITVN